MSKSNEVVTETVVTIEEQVAVILDPNSPEILPDNKLVSNYLSQGYQLQDGLRTRNRDDAKDAAIELRKQGWDAAYITLKQGWFGVFFKQSEEKQAKAAKATAKPDLPVEVAGMSFSSCKEARAYARLILEAAKQTEYDYDVEQARLAKVSATQI